MSLIDADIKLLLVNVHKSINTGIGAQAVTVPIPFGGVTGRVGGLEIPIIIPIPLEIDINSFSLGSLLDEIPGGNLVGLNTIVTSAESSIVINTTEITTPASALGASLLAGLGGIANNAVDPLNPDNSTANSSVLTQQPTGSSLKLSITFEIDSKLFSILGAIFDAAKTNIADYTFTYLSNELLIFDLKLGTVENIATNPNPVMNITFIEPVPKPLSKVTNSLVKDGAKEIT